MSDNSTNIKCNEDVQSALTHIRNKDLKRGLEMFKKYEGCHLRTPECPFSGDDCAIQDLIRGYVVAFEGVADG